MPVCFGCDIDLVCIVRVMGVVLSDRPRSRIYILVNFVYSIGRSDEIFVVKVSAIAAIFCGRGGEG